MSLQPVIRFEYVGACRYTGYEAKAIKLTLECGHDQASRKASMGVPQKARCRDCARGVPIYPKVIRTTVGATGQVVWFAWLSETEMLRDKRGVGRRFKSEQAARDALPTLND